ncbi:ribonuclease H-like protein, partial [Stereum hirsutum FP-91666 SS1]|uniref:ribonuclease H-like protein n=1 Tax=Stereum hirsutum (strain FP-91666) TaxID=721885 RepID=UPI0004449C4C
CPRFDSLPPSKQIKHCPDCRLFFAICCHLSDSDSDTVISSGKPCHHYRVVFTDGACPGNGTGAARSGMGIVLGMDEVLQWALPVDDDVDKFDMSVRMSQRAELLAALEGVKKMSALEALCYQPPAMRDGWHEERSMDERDRAPKQWIVVSDSEYVVKDMIEWVPSWKANGWKNARGDTPKNIDLFRRLDDAIKQEQARQAVEIRFWHVPREFNALADGLAKRAAEQARPVALPVS